MDPLHEIDSCSYRAAYQHNLGCLGYKPSHPAALIGLEVGGHDISESFRVKDFGHGLGHPFIQGIRPGVNECRMLVINKKLSEAEADRWEERWDPIHPPCNLIDLRHE